MFSGSCGEAFCDCPSRRAAGCIAYRDILCSPFTAGALAVLLCSVLCLHPPHNTPLTEAGPQQGLDAQQACAGTAEAVVCVEEEAQSGTDPLSLCGGFGYPSVMDLGVGWAWGQMLPLGYSIRSSACVEVVEDPSVLLVRVLCNPSALPALQQQQLLASWTSHVVAQGCNTSHFPSYVLWKCCCQTTFAQAEGQCGEDHNFQYLKNIKI